MQDAGALRELYPPGWRCWRRWLLALVVLAVVVVGLLAWPR